MKKIVVVIVAVLTSIFAAFGGDLYKLFIKEKIFTNEIVQKNISEDKKKEIQIYLSKDKEVKTNNNVSPNQVVVENYNQSDLDLVLNIILKTDAEFYQKISYRYSICSENLLKVNFSKTDQKQSKQKNDRQRSKNNKKAEVQEQEILKFQDLVLKMKNFRKKYQNCSRDAKILNNNSDNNPSHAKTQISESKKKENISNVNNEELQKEITEKYKIKKTELDCKKLVLLEVDRSPLSS